MWVDQKQSLKKLKPHQTKKARKEILKLFNDSFNKLSINFKSNKSYSTPKRLVVFFDGIPEKIEQLKKVAGYGDDPEVDTFNIRNEIEKATEKDQILDPKDKELLKKFITKIQGELSQ